MLGAYVCSKSALEALTRLTAVELGGSGVRANAIAPGIVETDLTRALLSDGPTWQALKMAIPLGRAGLVEEIAERRSRKCLLTWTGVSRRGGSGLRLGR